MVTGAVRVPLGAHERRLVLQLAAAATPPGVRLGPTADTLPDEVDAVLWRLGPMATRSYPWLLKMVDVAVRVRTGRGLTALPTDQAQRVLCDLASEAGNTWLLRAASVPIKIARCEEPGFRQALGLPGSQRAKVALPQPPRDLRMVDARGLDDHEELEVDVVVVGTGAGGAPLAHALASRGHAVLMLEEGGAPSRRDFQGDPIVRARRLYRHEVTLALGNALIPIPVGMGVGGTTTVNAGTCFRLPEPVLRRWRLDSGIADLDPDTLDPYFDRVEAMLEVGTDDAAALGGCARVIARGCEALGWAHGPLRRNAPGCDGQGECFFGCPTEAKRSTDVSFVPAAVGAGASVYTHARVEEILTDSGRATGVVARATREDGSRAELRVRATVTVLACGALHTPALLLANQLAGGSGQLGRNLTIHPASHAWARFDEEIHGYHAIPQGYGVDALVDEGIRMEGVFLPPALAAASFPGFGPEWTDFVERLDRTACFGFMIADHSRGRVTVDARGRPRIRYRLDDVDLAKVIRGHASLARVYFAGGARDVLPAIAGLGPLTSLADVERLERDGPQQLRARDIELTAYHPLGTCRMGVDASRSVIDGQHECHDVDNLFVVDGSAVRGPLGVNPQLTIMSLAVRASEFVERRIEGGPRVHVRASTAPLAVAASRPDATGLSFEETMAGQCRLVSDKTRAPIAVRITLHATAADVSDVAAALVLDGARWDLDGSIEVEGICRRAATTGSLWMRPRQRRGTIIYRLRFRGDDGSLHWLHGDKDVGGWALLRGMTTLHTEIRRDGDDHALAHGVLHFDLRHVGRWLASFARTRIAPRAVG